MSHQHTDRHGAGSDSETNERFGLERFVRNRYFSGKLMTARDMEAEQDYHANRLDTFAQHVIGEGVVCGLDTTVDPTDEGITVSLEAGVAIDAHGRLVVVDGDTEIPFTGSDAPDDDFSLFLELDPCDSEKVPKKGAQDACKESCEYNRVVEDYRLVLDSGPPASAKPIPDLDFPTVDEKYEMADRASDAPPHPAKSKPTRSFNSSTENGTFRYTRCGSGGDAAVFLGYYQDAGDGSYYLDKDTHPRHFVYTNDLLYAAILDHATDLENPHDTLDTINDVPHTGGDIDLVSDDESVAVDASEARDHAVSLEIADDVQAEIEMLAEYVRDKSLKYTIEAFYDVAATYADVDSDGAASVNDRAADVIRRASEALDEAAHADKREFADAIREIGQQEREILRLLDESRTDSESLDLATDRSFDDYEAAVEELTGLLPTAADGSIEDSLPAGFETVTSTTALAVRQDQLAETATWLERTTSETVTIPGGHELESRIIEDIIHPSVVEETEDTGLRPGDLVVDADAAEQETAVVIKVAEETAEEWTVYGDETVAYQNPDYDAEERVVVVTYEHLLDEHWPYWEAADPDDLFYGIVTRSIKFHAFPESRLERAG